MSAVPVTPAAVPAAPAARKRRGYAGVKELGKRVGIYVITFFVAITVNFLIPRVMPGNPAAKVIAQLEAATGSAPSPATIRHIDQILGNPHAGLISQYFTYLGHTLSGNLGTSSSYYPLKVTTVVGRALPWTLGLVVISMLIAFALGISLGAISGWLRGRRFDTFFLTACAVLLAVPSFFFALVVQYVFAYKLKLFPATGAYDPTLVKNWSFGFAWSVIKYGFLPSLTLVVITFAGPGLSMRNMMVQTASDDFVLLAKAKGLSPRQVIGSYAARNSLLPQVAGLAQNIGSAIGGVLVIELVFTYPGIGSLMLRAIDNNDFALIQGIFLVIIVAMLVMNFLADSIYVLLDPRTRAATE